MNTLSDMERKAVVAGQFYPAGKKALEGEVRRLLACRVGPRPAIAAISPHAGYAYSGAVAGHVFSSIVVPRHCIILSPNHTGQGARAALWKSGGWEIPTGRLPVDEALGSELLAECNELSEDRAAHLNEHSLEVILPFLLARQSSLSIVPITLARLSPASCRSLGEGIARAIRAQGGEPPLIIASTDMNHYEEHGRTLAKDGLAIERVLTLDADGLIATCREHQITMCGVVPVAVTIWAARSLGATKALLVDHTTSGDVTGDYDAVVGYAGFVIE